MDEMKETRDALRAMLVDVQETCRLAIRIVGGDEEIAPLVEKIRQLEDNADDEMIRITEALTEIVGKLYLAGLLKRAVVCDAVVAHEAEAMFDLLQHVGENWQRIMESEPATASDEARILIDSMLQNCIVMLEKCMDILDGKDMTEHTLKFIWDLDEKINQANDRAHEVVLLSKANHSVVARMIRIIKAIENLGDKIKSLAIYILYIRTGEFTKVKD